jgi:bifunctional UDP-N-acetylglucosamine pyrophosphorylase/glucosamine-1-phosphate N-acetyltransferase
LPTPAPLTVLVLAAGVGKRMTSQRIKLLHPVAGRPMVVWVLQAARALRPARLITVVGHQGEDVREATRDLTDVFVDQREPLGTGHAVLQAAPRLRGTGPVLILNGDLPTLRPATLRKAVSAHRASGAALTVVTCEVENPSGYGRIVRDDRGRVRRIVEHRDAQRAERKIREINCGVYCARISKLLPVLKELRPDNAQGELYLTDAVHKLLERGEEVAAFLHADAEEVLGVNDRNDLARAGRTLHARKADRTWIDPRARIGQDSVVYPNVIVEGPCRIGRECTLRSGVRLVDSAVGDGVEIKEYSVLTDSRIGDGCAVGPFAHLRPGSVLEAGVKVGNFVEVKKSRLAEGTKASHLSYLGDADIGAGSNIGAGTITCNYDGAHKHPTRMGRGVFVGSDTQLVAPVSIGDGAYVGAGTTVTKDVPAGALAISRAPQTNLEGWAERRKKKKKAGKGGSRS